MAIRIGISRWRYPRWRGDFYPPGLRQADELAYAAGRLGSVEINGTFYSLQRPSSFRTWYDQTPDDFIFSVKGSRFVTHYKRLSDPRIALANFWASGLLALSDKLGPVLWQLPPTMRFDQGLLTRFFAELPRTTTAAAELSTLHDARVSADRAITSTDDERTIRYALEFRHPSFDSPEARELCRQLDVALVVADTAGRLPVVSEATADLVYVRLHGSTELYTSGYSSAELTGWARRLGAWDADGHDVYVYLDNDAKGRAPHDAVALQTCLSDLAG